MPGLGNMFVGVFHIVASPNSSCLGVASQIPTFGEVLDGCQVHVEKLSPGADVYVDRGIWRCVRE